MAYIEFRNIHKYFGSSHVLKGINLGVEYGQMVTLLGPSGCGKSTLLRCLAGLEQVNEGQIFLDGKDITNLTPKQRNIGMVFQQYSLFPTMTVRQNVAFGLQIQKMEKSKIDANVGQDRPLSAPAVRRPAAACCAGPCDCHRAEGAAAGRAAQRD